jgi:hypothetical protein
MTLPGEISNSDDSSRYEIQSEQLTQYLIKELTKQQYETLGVTNCKSRK